MRTRLPSRVRPGRPEERAEAAEEEIGDADLGKLQESKQAEARRVREDARHAEGAVEREVVAEATRQQAQQAQRLLQPT